MGDVYLYAPDEDDFSTIGFCGALTPTSCTFHEVANGGSSLTLEHPLDRLNRYTQLVEGCILKADVPVRTTPEIAGGAYVTVVEQWAVQSTATKANRYIYSGKNPSKNKKKLYCVPVGGEVFVVAKYADDSLRWKVKYSYTVKKKGKATAKTVTGFMAHDSSTLALIETRSIPDSSTGIETVAPSMEVEEQLFRINSVKKADEGITVEAMHLSYDLMENLTTYSENGTKTLAEAAQGVLDGCLDDHDFSFQTNITGSKAGFHYADKDPITALLDPDTGLIPRWGGQLIRDNYALVALNQAGVNRGMLLTYGKNIAGIEMETDISNVATAIRPIGENADGTPLYLEHSFLCDADFGTTQLADTKGIVYGTCHSLSGGELSCALPFARIAPLSGDDCKVDTKNGVSAALVRTRLLAQAVDKLKNGAQTPEISIRVDMQLLGYTKRWELYRPLEKAFLFDTVGVRHSRLNINADVTISEIEWDCLMDRPLTFTLGTVSTRMPSVASWQIQDVNGTKILPGTITAGKIADGAVHAGALSPDDLFTLNLANLQSGLSGESISVPAGASSDVSVTFPHAFASGSVPVVVAGLKTDSTGDNFGLCCCAVISVTGAGFTARICNGDTAVHAAKIVWIALR